MLRSNLENLTLLVSGRSQAGPAAHDLLRTTLSTSAATPIMSFHGQPSKAQYSTSIPAKSSKKRKHSQAKRTPSKDARSRLCYDNVALLNPELLETPTNWSTGNPSDQICRYLELELGSEDVLGGLDYKHRNFFRRCVRDRWRDPGSARAERKKDIETLLKWADEHGLDKQDVKNFYGTKIPMSFADGPLGGVDPSLPETAVRAGVVQAREVHLILLC